MEKAEDDQDSDREEGKFEELMEKREYFYALYTVAK